VRRKRNKKNVKKRKAREKKYLGVLDVLLDPSCWVYGCRHQPQEGGPQIPRVRQSHKLQPVRPKFKKIKARQTKENAAGLWVYVWCFWILCLLVFLEFCSLLPPLHCPFFLDRVPWCRIICTVRGLLLLLLPYSCCYLPTGLSLRHTPNSFCTRLQICTMLSSQVEFWMSRCIPCNGVPP
jgi:hypothetical protein